MCGFYLNALEARRLVPAVAGMAIVQWLRKLMGTMGAVAAGGDVGSSAGDAMAGGMSSDKETKAEEAEAQKADEAAQTSNIEQRSGHGGNLCDA
ncbi:MAG: hypothetical protein EOP12_02995 [Pseudomonas sp.]|nr:MAG: hypothetical protein EOP12_02995 [Pseudomonas sp.]